MLTSFLLRTLGPLCAGVLIAACGTAPPEGAPASRAVAPRPAPTSTSGPLFLEGGGGAVASVGRAFVEAAGGPDASLCIIETANDLEFPAFRRFEGLELAGLEVLNPDYGQAGQTALIEALERCTGYYFGGGDPERLAEVLRPPGQQTSPALSVIRQRILNGGAAFGGISAGAMVAGPKTLCTCGPNSSVEALVDGELKIADSFDLLPGVLVDAHFFARGLIGRHLVALERHGADIGVGIDEDTAVTVRRGADGGTEWLVAGRRPVGLFRRDPSLPAGSWRFDILAAGDRFLPDSGFIEPAADRPLMLIRPATDRTLGVRDMFGPGTVVRAVGQMIGAGDARVTGGVGDARIVIERTASTRVYDSLVGTTILDLVIRLERGLES